MNARQDHIAVYTFVVFLFSFSLFCYGFFPLSFSPSTKANLDELPQSVGNASFNGIDYKPKISRAVLMVIDALRMDFVLQEENFQFLNKLLGDGKACLYRLQVHPPTVTMPRIKAMTSGAIPSFLDVILNLGSPEMKLDTFLYQMRQRQQKTVFYGDNTWTNMFPEMFHRQGENSDSLYVNDFYKGDRNITKFLKMELQMYDWKLMILHYLGLDHIGHVEGPFSDKVPGKLKEMDKVIETIYQAMDKWKQKYYTKPLLVITGDHGMRDSGGHGGSTHPETIVPVIVVSDQCAKSEETFLQIDLAPTMSVLMGVAIPYASIGSIIDPALRMLHRKEMLHTLYYNTQRLVSKVELILSDKFTKTELHHSFEEAKQLHQKFMKDVTDVSAYKRTVLLYTSVSKKLTQLLISSYIRYDIVFIVIGMIMSFLCATIAVLQLLQGTDASVLTLQPKLFPSINCMLLSFLLLKLLSFEKESSAEPSNYFHAALVFLSVVYFTLWAILSHLFKSMQTTLWASFKSGTHLSRFIWFGTVFHCISLGSSSFIEEEHQTWYYLTSTIMILLTLKEVSIMNGTIDTLHRHTKTDASLLEVCKEERSIFCVSSIAFLCVHVVIRRFNQTGDKWQHLPDVGDWLSKEEHKLWLSLTMLVGLCYLVYQICYLAGLLTTVLSLTASMLIYYYRAASGAVTLFGLKASNSTICLTIFWINLVEIFFIGFLPKIYRTIMGRSNAQGRSGELYSNCIIIVALLSALLHKPHNVLLVGALLATSRFISERIDRIADDKHCSVLLKVITHYWLGKMFYFYQGNSNSLASIDLNAGYVGLNNFDMLRVGVFLTLHTFSGPILSFLLLLQHLFSDNERDLKQHHLPVAINARERILMFTNVLITVPVSFFIVIATVLRDHIFVWTVFSPKIIYEYFTVWLVLIQVILVWILLPKKLCPGV